MKGPYGGFTNIRGRFWRSPYEGWYAEWGLKSATCILVHKEIVFQHSQDKEHILDTNNCATLVYSSAITPVLRVMEDFSYPPHEYNIPLVRLSGSSFSGLVLPRRIKSTAVASAH